MPKTPSQKSELGGAQDFQFKTLICGPFSYEDQRLNIIQDIPKNLSGCFLPAFLCKAYNASLNVNISVYSEPYNHAYH